ncbi:MAG: DUF721 domain-containing protein [Alphaproteobacteria bacterium]|nr:DUF721 domain-containing protein [Alphaproteobacteria bacterium]
MSDFKSMPSIINKTLSGLLKGDNYDVARLVFNWEEIVGKNFASFTNPIKISVDFKTQKKTLSIGVSNNSFGTELHYMKTSIIGKINFFCGKNVVEDIKVVLRPMGS